MVVWTHPASVQANLLQHRDHLDTYVPLLRPSYCRPNPQIDANQLYISFIYIRSLRFLPDKRIYELSQRYGDCVDQITGSLASIIEIEDILRYSDITNLLGNIFGRRKNNFPAERLHSMINDYLSILKDVRRRKR